MARNDSTPTNGFEMTMPIRFAGKVEAHEMLRAYMLAWKGTWQMRGRTIFLWVGSISAATFLIIGFHAFQHDNVRAAWRIWTPAIFVVICLVISVRNLRTRVARALRTGVFNESTEVVISDNDIIFNDGKASLQIHWEKLSGLRYNDEIVILYLSYPRSFLALFRQFGKTPDDFDRLITLAGERLPKM
jgi:hypothetical protein